MTEDAFVAYCRARNYEYHIRWHGKPVERVSVAVWAKWPRRELLAVGEGASFGEAARAALWRRGKERSGD